MPVEAENLRGAARSDVAPPLGLVSAFLGENAVRLAGRPVSLAWARLD